MLKQLYQDTQFINRNLVVRIAIISGLFAFIAAEIFLLVKEKYTYAIILAGLPLMVMIALFLLQNLHYAPLAILITGAFIPLSLPTGRGSPIVASLALSLGVAGFWLLKMAVVDKQIALQPSPVNKPAFGFMVVTIISLIWSNLLRDPSIYVPNVFIFVQLGAAAVMVISPVVMLMVGNFVRQERTLKMMVAVLMVLGVLGLIENFGHIDLFSNSGGLTSLWVIALCAGTILFMDDLPKIYRIVFLILGSLWILWNFILNISWIAGWLPGIVALGVITFFRSKRAFIFLLVLLAGYYLVNKSFLAQDINAETKTSGETRVSAWQANWSVTKDHLLFGTGPAGYAAYYMTLFPNNAMATHNNYIDIIAETGVVGTFFYLWMFAALVVQGWRLIKRLRGRRDFYEALSIAAFSGLIACIVIMAFGDWMLPFAYTQTIAGYNYTVYSWLFIGTLLAVNRITEDTNVIPNHQVSTG